MSVRSGFYNAENHDRRYNALDFGNLFDGLISNGIYATVGEAFVGRFTNGYCEIGTGRAWFDHCWIYNDSPFRITPTASDFSALGDTRWDAIAITTNSYGRSVGISMYKGTLNSDTKPTLTDTDWIKYHILYYVKWRLAENSSTKATYLYPDDYTNVRGTSQTPFVTGIIDHISADSLIGEWRDQWDVFMTGKVSDYDTLKKTIEKQIKDWESDLETGVKAWQAEQLSEINAWYATQKGQFESWENTFKSDANTWYSTQTSNMNSWQTTFKNTATNWYNSQKTSLTSWENTFKSDANTWYSTQKGYFDSWFSNLQVQLDGDVAAHLQNEIDNNIGAITDAQWASITKLLK